jgi:TfoX/Sxy family transcriptional regulator of competence genes
MAINPLLTKRVRDVLTSEKDVVEKKMFRGIAFMINGKMCVTVGDDKLMLRIDPALHETAISRPGVTTVKMKGRDYIGWIYVNESVVPGKRELTLWIKKALSYNTKLQ